MDDRTTAAGTGAEHWRGVLLTGAGAAAGSGVFIVVQIAVFALHPPPASVDGFFVLMDENPLLGMLSLDLLLSVNNVLVALVYLALIVVLWDRARSTAAIAGLLMVLGMAAYLSSNPAVDMLLLSQQHASATPADQPALVAAGEVLLASWRGTAFLTYYVLNGIALLLVAIALLRTKALGRALGWWALASGVLMLVPSTFGLIGLVMSVLSLLPWCVMCVIAAARLRALAAGGLEPSQAHGLSASGSPLQ